MIISPSDGNLFEAVDFKSEKELQDYIEQSPKLLNVISEINQQEYPLFILGREFNVHSGSIDFIAIDVEGSLYIIETKLAENPEIRRKIIGQVVEYANDITDKPYDWFAEKCFDYLTKAGVVKKGQASLEDLLRDFYVSQAKDTEEVLTAEEYKKAITANLTKGRLNLVIVANRVSFEIQKLFHFVDEKTSDDLNFIVIEINKYKIGSNAVLHSGIVWAAKYIKSLFSRTSIKEAKFLEQRTSRVRELIEHINQWCAKKELDKVSTTKGLSWKAASGGSILVMGNTLDSNWATLRIKPGESKDLDIFKAGVLKTASEKGFEISTQGHGRMKVELTNQFRVEDVEQYLTLAFSVIEKAESIANKSAS
jgi:hypothetical protein